ncbi:hypothetical protein [Terrihabitans sp. B22-R8]|uniref:hypothetical protein n=1 Tax=Terrihabitans sp. B22-R8 TaxID=3425128 RepID=UPI00403C87AD
MNMPEHITQTPTVPLVLESVEAILDRIEALDIKEAVGVALREQSRLRLESAIHALVTILDIADAASEDREPDLGWTAWETGAGDYALTAAGDLCTGEENVDDELQIEDEGGCGEDYNLAS